MLVEASEQGVVVEDIPDAVLDLFEADVLTVEGLGKEVLAGVESEGAAVADAPDLEVSRVGRRRDALRVGAA
ncbi:MAG: hypothetical protein ACRDGM_00505 [bacterium]